VLQITLISIYSDIGSREWVCRQRNCTQVTATLSCDVTFWVLNRFCRLCGDLV